MPDAAPQPLNAQQYLEQLRALQADASARDQALASSENTMPTEAQVPVPPPPRPEAPLRATPDPRYNQNQELASPPVEVMDERYYRPQPEETVYEWQAPSRPFKKRNRQYFVTIAIIVFLISLILFFAGQFLPIAVVIAVAFLAYVLSSVPPELIKNRITTFGVHNDQAFYYWDELGRFWLDVRYGKELVHIETNRFPGRVTLLLNSVEDKQQVTELLSEILLQEKPKDTAFDKAAQWLQNKIPLDSDT